MKLMWQLLPPAVKAVAMVVFFFISIGWASYGAVLLIVKAEGKDIRKEATRIRRIDIEHLDKRFDRIERLIKEEL